MFRARKPCRFLRTLQAMTLVPHQCGVEVGASRAGSLLPNRGDDILVLSFEPANQRLPNESNAKATGSREVDILPQHALADEVLNTLLRDAGEVSGFLQGQIGAVVVGPRHCTESV